MPSTAGAALLVVIAAVSQEVGAAFAVGLFASVGAVGAVLLRLGISGVVLCVAVRPRIRGLTGRAWGTAAALAVSLTVMNVCFYLALTRIPLGVTVTIEVLGPLLLSVIVSSRWTAWLWAVIAFVGVALLGLTQHHTAGIDAVGFGYAAAAGMAWAGYILASARTAIEFDRVDGLALATAIGALLLAPWALLMLDTVSALRWDVLGLGLLVALMSSALPYSLELISLRSLPAETFAVVTCLSPVVATIAGLLVLGQQLGAPAWLAIVLVTVASVGAVRAAPPREALPPA
ncbi:MAG: EamA family transporter [Mycobacterium sp.]